MEKDLRIIKFRCSDGDDFDYYNVITIVPYYKSEWTNDETELFKKDTENMLYYKIVFKDSVIAILCVSKKCKNLHIKTLFKDNRYNLYIEAIGMLGEYCKDKRLSFCIELSKDEPYINPSHINDVLKLDVTTYGSSDKIYYYAIYQ